MKSPLKNLKKYFQLIMTALICFVMGVIEDKKRICIKDTDSKKDRTVLRPDDKKNNRKNKIIYWNEPRMQKLSQSSQLMNLRQFSRILCSDEQDQYALFTRIAI